MSEGELSSSYRRSQIKVAVKVNQEIVPQVNGQITQQLVE